MNTSTWFGASSVPKVLRNSVIPFRFNSYEDLDKAVKKHAKNCAAIILSLVEIECLISNI